VWERSGPGSGWKNLGKSRKNDGKTVGKSKKTMEKHGKTLGKSRKTMGNHGKPRKI